MRSILGKIKDFIYEEDGNESVEFAVIFPVLLLIIGFMIDRFIQYEGLTSLTAAANEAVRSAVVAETEGEAAERIRETLEDRLATSGMGWCAGDENDTCASWDGSSAVSDRSSFEGDNSSRLLISVDNGWCSGSYITVGVRAHKSSLFPSFENFRHMMKSGGPVYHTHTYIIKARVESKEKCS